MNFLETHWINLVMLALIFGFFIYNIIVWYNRKRHGDFYQNAQIALRDVCDKIDAARAGYPVDNMHQLLRERSYLQDLVEGYEGR